MARQTSDILFTGTLGGSCGYVLRNGSAVFARKPGPKAGRRHRNDRLNAEQQRFGEISCIGSVIWRNLPRQLKLLSGEHGYHRFLKALLLGNRRMSGFCLNLDVPEEGGDCLTGGLTGEIGEDIALSGRDFPRTVVVMGGLSRLDGIQGKTGREFMGFLPAGGHHVTGGTGRARSKGRRAVLAKAWNVGEGLRDRREKESQEWEAAARAKGFSSAAGWFRGMAANLGLLGIGASGSDEEGRVLMRVVVGCIRDGKASSGQPGREMRAKSWSWQGGWQPAGGGVEVELPRWRSGAVFAGVEYGYMRGGVVVPLQCLNRVWCVGLWPAAEEGTEMRILVSEVFVVETGHVQMSGPDIGAGFPAVLFDGGP